MERLSWYLCSILVTAALVPAGVHADEKAAVDGDFLEFLGSLDNDDAAWAAYLSSVDTPESNAPKPAKPAEKPAPEGDSK
jgi:hypothetical protein